MRPDARSGLRPARGCQPLPVGPQDRAERLSAFLSPLMEAPFAWGEGDCTLRPAQWVADELGVALDLPDYRSKAEALRLIAGAGGLERLWAGVLDRMLSRTIAPALGDVGVIALNAGQTGAIFGHNRMAYVWGEQGTGILQPRAGDILAAWRLP